MYNCSLCSKEVVGLAVRQANKADPLYDKGLCSSCLELVQYLAMSSTAESIAEFNSKQIDEDTFRNRAKQKK